MMTNDDSDMRACYDEASGPRDPHSQTRSPMTEWIQPDFTRIDERLSLSSIIAAHSASLGY